MGLELELDGVRRSPALGDDLDGARRPAGAVRWLAASDDDAALVADAKRDSAAFEALYRRYTGRVYHYCYRRLGDEVAAEDAASLVFAKALAALSGCRERSFRSWLFTIAHNVVTDQHRATAPLSRSLADAADVVDPAPTPEEWAMATDESQALHRLLAQLPPDQRRVVELRLAGLTGAEIATVLGRSHGAVKKLQSRAIARLRTLFGVARDQTEVF